MSTYAQEQAAKRATERATATRYRFTRAGWDLIDAHARTPPDGAIVVKTQPYGCPKNGTLGHCYVENADTGEFYGLVQETNLARVRR